jgi:glycosyltransferase involved in cell wall biosynthesis
MIQPLVSIHIITYNQIQFIHETMNSVLSQTYENIEIIVADDGSTDGTAEIVLDYARQYPRKIIPIVGGPNLGITGNSNRGLEACKGKYISFLGGDDLMHPDKISIQVEHMEANPICSISYHNLDVFEHETGKTLYLYNERHKPCSGNVRTLIKNGCVNGGSSTMVRSEHIPPQGFDRNITLASDWLFWIETLLNHNGDICYINKILGRYRRHGNNVTRITNESYSTGEIDHLASCMKILFLHPKYSNDILFRLGALLRGARKTRGYQACLIASLRCSIQLKTVVLLLAYFSSLKTVML